ncbi:uncharacterized protein DNG_06250 [Cephalotrichum gorgonifer]|uniref:Uncharacterized protein n=1 Tax=Cephalotrichum gorgonifer TaxID=2041049 RepID=A0AAE8N2E9_9PEZI|nr:uncharacterized protein DNG_06250 [Cephalotrichum gorgonifer]
MASNILTITYLFFFILESKQVPLDEMDVVFGGQSHVTERGNMTKADPEAAARRGVDFICQQRDERRPLHSPWVLLAGSWTIDLLVESATKQILGETKES